MTWSLVISFKYGEELLTLIARVVRGLLLIKGAITSNILNSESLRPSTNRTRKLMLRTSEVGKE
jgi:hypothetical protein